ncbi:trypsin-like serine peptidase [Trinickia diaoshuihuensis]|uniref:trypsin-like serine peptidase n=1 Tax=Trinickia diaoshuihuensis TaxID=2292265 RepID=UPI000E25721F|nr:trypsin-like serine protease [Trinickia diaoshuihuensis]
MNKIAMYLGISLFGSAIAVGASAQQVKVHGAVTHFTQPAQAAQSSMIDFAHAQPMPLPTTGFAAPAASDALLQPPARMGAPGAVPGGQGDGKRMPLQLAPTRALDSQDQVSPQEFGTSNQPFTTNRVNAAGDNTQFYYAFRPAGKLFFNIGSATYVCSASLIKPGIVVTAAHCVANFGRQQFYGNWQFVPAYSNGSAPYGVWRAASATILTSYYNGTDSCAVSGVVCQDDVAVLTLAPQSGSYAGNRTGWYGYGWNGYGFNGSAQALINQLGYPVALDGGLLMERNDSQGYTAASFSNNTIIGSLMTGGSSGGPWEVNLGIAPSLSGTSFGAAAARNTVVGVTSWGYTDTTIKQQGASPFTSGNIVVLVNAVCSATPGAC